MKNLHLHKQGFPAEPDVEKVIPLTKAALYRAVVAAGRNPDEQPATSAVKSDIAGRLHTLNSAIDTSGVVPRPTPEFLAEGSTIKGQKSFLIGNALCAHSALHELKIPWLLDVEQLKQYHGGISIGTSKSGRRPDYLGLDVDGNWHVFESKGRSERPGPRDITGWKEQANSIQKVNGLKVQRHVVSAAYLNASGEWELLWVDPEGDEDDPEIEVSIGRFLQIYYHELRFHVLRGEQAELTPLGAIVMSSEADVGLGLHHTVLAAFANAPAEIDRFLEGTSKVMTLWQSARITTGMQLDQLMRRQALEWPEISSFWVAELLKLARSKYEENSQGMVMVGEIAAFADGILISNENSDPWEALFPSTHPSDWPPMMKTPSVSSQDVGKSERATQDRVIALFRDELKYRYLGDRSDRTNSNIDEALATSWLKKAGHTPEQISRALYLLRTEADNLTRGLYANNQKVYALLRYGVPVKVEADKVMETVKLIDWEHQELNDFAIAEEVTLKGGLERRPDLGALPERHRHRSDRAER
jgi:hypothetical protein